MQETRMATIKEKLDLKMEEFLSILPTQVRELIRGNCYFAGGCIRSLVNNETPKDYDVYLTNQKVADALVALEDSIELMFDIEYNVFKESKMLNSYTLYSKHKLGSEYNTQFQLIFIEAGMPEDSVAAFDFTMNMNYYYNGNLYVHDVDSIKTKQLRVNPVCRNTFDTYHRVFKFMERGYYAPPKSDITRLAMNLSQMEPLKTEEDVRKVTRQCASSII